MVLNVTEIMKIIDDDDNNISKQIATQAPRARSGSI
jgi:hypothetical protein